MATRRQFLIGSAAIAGGVAIGYRLYLPEKLRDIEVGPGQTAVTPYVVIDQRGITIIAPRAEMGQGIHTTLAALVAEELDVTFEELRVEHGPASEHYANNVFYGPQPYPGRTHRRPAQATGGQTSTRDAFVKMRKAGAAARIMLMQAAALRLGVDAMTLSTRNGTVVAADGREILYTDLAEAAASIEPPADPPLKPRSKWRLLGKSLPRVDMVAKCNGTAEFGIDVSLPGLLYATVRRNPRRGSKMLGYDASKVLTLPGVENIIPMDNGVIVVATNTWHALRAADQIAFEWAPSRYPETTAGHRETVERAFDEDPYYRPEDHGDVEAALRDGAVIEGQYRVPYLAHATMEPMNATAWLRDGRLDVWAGNQFPTLVAHTAARLTGLPRDVIRVHTPYMGGGFGRRFEMDDVEAAVRAALAMPGQPIRVMYSREEDMSQDMYRPIASARFRATLAGAKPEAIDLDLSAPSLFNSSHLRTHERTGERMKRVPKADVSLTMGAKDQRYEIENLRITAYRPGELLPVGWWRSVGESQNLFFFESIMDELAHAAGADPLTMRLALLSHEPSREVLESVAEMSDWGSDLPDGHARGIAYGLCSGQATAEVIEISHTDGRIKVHKAFAAVDVGVALDPRNIEAQVQGSLLFGLSAAIYGEITVSDGGVDQVNFDGYPLLRLGQAPSIEVRILESGEAIKGVGEAGTATAAPALCNAIFTATGRRIRELPLRKHFRFV